MDPTDILSKEWWKTAAVTGAVAAATTLGYTTEADAQVHRKEVPMEDGHITFLYDNNRVQDFDIHSDVTVGDENSIADISYQDLFGDQYMQVLKAAREHDIDTGETTYSGQEDSEQPDILLEQYASDLAKLEQAEEALAGMEWSNEYRIIDDAQDRYIGLVNERLAEHGIAIEEEQSEQDTMYRLVSTR